MNVNPYLLEYVQEKVKPYGYTECTLVNQTIQAVLEYQHAHS